MKTFKQYINEAKKSSGVPGRGGEGWGAASGDSLDAALDLEKQRREEALARLAEKQAETLRKAALEQAKRAKRAKEEEEELRKQLNQYGFWDFNKK